MNCIIFGAMSVSYFNEKIDCWWRDFDL